MQKDFSAAAAWFVHPAGAKSEDDQLGLVCQRSLYGGNSVDKKLYWTIMKYHTGTILTSTTSAGTFQVVVQIGVKLHVEAMSTKTLQCHPHKAET